MITALSEREKKEILDDYKFRPYLMEFLHRRDKEKAIRNMSKNIILVDHISEKDIINCNDQNAINHVLIEGENLYALSALGILGEEDKFDIILIDPIYGTQTNNFRYNDKLIHKDDPQGILKWKISIENRLKLVKRLMKPDGVIMCFINYENCHLLRLCMDKVFGRENVLAQRPWKKKGTPGNNTNSYLDHLDYICVYSINKKELKVDNFVIPKSEKMLKRFQYDNKDEKGRYELTPFEKSGNKGSDRPKCKYKIIDPDGKEHFPKKQWWRWSEKKYNKDKNDFIEWKKNKSGKNKGRWSPMVRGYLKDEKGNEKMTTPSCIIDEKGTLNTDGIKSAEELLNKNISSMNPKPPELLKMLIKEVNKKDVRILDYYAGLNTTLQAVIELNQEDDQKRVCFCVQNEEGIDKIDNNRIIDDAYLRIKNLMTSIKENNIYQFSKKIEVIELKQNLRYFIIKLVPVDFLKMSEGKKYQIFRQSYDLIKMINDSYIIIHEGDSYKIFISKNKVIIVLNENWDNSFEEEQEIDKLIEKYDLLRIKIIAYECSTDDECESDEYFDEVHPVPHEIKYSQERSYKMLQ